MKKLKFIQFICITGITIKTWSGSFSLNVEYSILSPSQITIRFGEAVTWSVMNWFSYLEDHPGNLVSEEFHLRIWICFITFSLWHPPSGVCKISYIIVTFISSFWIGWRVWKGEKLNVCVCVCVAQEIDTAWTGRVANV